MVPSKFNRYLNHFLEEKVPIGRYKNPVKCDATDLENIRYSNVVIQISDYKEALFNAKKDDFIYSDPPYHPMSTMANFTGYTKRGFGNNDQSELVKNFSVLNDRGCKVLLSNSDTSFIRRLYSDSSDYY
jgi:DNA adenine methylase